jgi:hypothetical protein
VTPGLVHVRPDVLPWLRDPFDQEEEPMRAVMTAPLGQQLEREASGMAVMACLAVLLCHVRAPRCGTVPFPKLGDPTVLCCACARGNKAEGSSVPWAFANQGLLAAIWLPVLLTAPWSFVLLSCALLGNVCLSVCLSGIVAADSEKTGVHSCCFVCCQGKGGGCPAHGIVKKCTLAALDHGLALACMRRCRCG